MSSVHMGSRKVRTCPTFPPYEETSVRLTGSGLERSLWRGSLREVIWVVLWVSWVCVTAGQSASGASQLYYQVDEEIGPGSIIGDVVKDARLAEKYDLSTIPQLRFQFLTAPVANFTVDPRSGLISTNGRLDRDLICPGSVTCATPFNIAIHANKIFQVVKASVEILDLNDNSPKFPEPRTVIQVLESAQPGTTTYRIPEAVDPDSPSNAVQTYQLVTEGSDTWRLNVQEEVDGAREVMLILTDSLDRETTAHYHLQVVAYDGGTNSRSGSIDVYIEVEDANDNAPIFDKSSYEVTIDENTPLMTTIIQMRAQDADWGANGQVSYSLSSRSASAYGHLFGVNNSTGQVYVKALIDYEANPTYHLTIVAKDQGQNPVPSTASLMINVRDLNDHSPLITVNTLLARNTNRTYVPEDSPVDSFVAHVIVNDPDSGTNGAFNCSLQDRAFRLQQTYPEEFHILTSIELDREKRSEYGLALKCVDKGSPPLTSTKHIIVSVTDVNDNPPVFKEKAYMAELFENNYIGAYVTRVNATDADEGKNAEIVYGLGPSDLAYFEIDSATGIIKARDSLDREQRSEYNLKVVARDSGTPKAQTASVNLLVKILDVNDEKPLFSSAVYSFGVDENQPAGHQVGVLTAHDADSPPYNEHSIFLLPAGSLSDAFEMDANGMVRTTRELDREEQSVYELIAVARDINSPTITSTATVSIHVMDLNDNAPLFIFPTPQNHTVQMSHKVPLGYIVTQVKAKDLDRDSNGKVMYQLTKGNTEGVFTVDPNLGSVSINVDLRDYPDNKTWLLEVTAMDYGDPQLSTSATLHVVLNHSLALGGGVFSSLFSGSNFVILIIVGCISGALIVVLLIVIVVLLRKQQMKRRRMHRYNCRMHALQRMTAEEMMTESTKKDSAYHNNKGKISEAEYTIIPKKEPDAFSNEDKIDLSHEKSRQWLETLEPNRYEASPIRCTTRNDEKKCDSPHQGGTPQNGRANNQPQPIRKEMTTATLPRAGNNPSPRPLSSVLEDSASDSVKSGEGSNTDSGRGNSDADDNVHGSSGRGYNSVQYTPLPPPPPAPQYQSLPGYHSSRYTRPSPQCQSFTSFRGTPTNNNVNDEHVRSSPTGDQHAFNSPKIGHDTNGSSSINGAETVAIRPQGSPILNKNNQRRIPRKEDYKPSQDGTKPWFQNGQGSGADRETNC